ncbi:hypothetical protein A7K99_15755 [Tatumella citrea]|uniref:Uncharacterized protein n=1 Tax=Tatumella citrea TaxID=53336 RepID=A0A1Y0LBM1_TATCI|nr:hypothetical protein A7K98_15770 [Tatumella citrea]ARU99108.1 hypothetical protein A7K99_15755 [Tatumella citrea]
MTEFDMNVVLMAVLSVRHLTITILVVFGIGTSLVIALRANEMNEPVLNTFLLIRWKYLPFMP